jgi:hypothetical protein
MRVLLVCCLLLAAFGCKGEPETDVVKAPDLPKPEETAGGSGVGTGVRKIGEIKKN